MCTCYIRTIGFLCYTNSASDGAPRGCIYTSRWLNPSTPTPVCVPVWLRCKGCMACRAAGAQAGAQRCKTPRIIGTGRHAYRKAVTVARLPAVSAEVLPVERSLPAGCQSHTTPSQQRNCPRGTSVPAGRREAHQSSGVGGGSQGTSRSMLVGMSTTRMAIASARLGTGARQHCPRTLCGTAGLRGALRTRAPRAAASRTWRQTGR